jgi:Winged helix DNA-binding domain
VATLDEHLRAWTYERQRLGRAAANATDALRDVIAVYSAHPSAPLALHARAATFDATAFRRLRTLRLPAMRGSIHVLPAKTGHLAFRALPEAPARSARRLRNAGLTQAQYEKLRAALLDAAPEPTSARTLREAVGAEGSLAPVLSAMAHEGVLVRVGAHGLRSNELLYLAADVEEADADEALAWLAGEYLRAFGPVTLADFAWWTGASKGRAKAALAAVDTEELDDGLLLRAEDREAFDAVEPATRGAVDLLPKWDPLAMGYAPGGRGRFADDAIVGRLYEGRGTGGATSGDSLPIVLVDGAAAGTWSVRAGDGKDLELETDLFDSAGPKLRKAIDARLDAVRALLA